MSFSIVFLPDPIQGLFLLGSILKCPMSPNFHRRRPSWSRLTRTRFSNTRRRVSRTQTIWYSKRIPGRLRGVRGVKMLPGRIRQQAKKARAGIEIPRAPRGAKCLQTRKTRRSPFQILCLEEVRRYRHGTGIERIRSRRHRRNRSSIPNHSRTRNSSSTLNSSRITHRSSILNSSRIVNRSSILNYSRIRNHSRIRNSRIRNRLSLRFKGRSLPTLCRLGMRLCLKIRHLRVSPVQIRLSPTQ